MTNSVDQDQLASSEANWSGSTLFAKAQHIQVQQDQSWIVIVPVNHLTATLKYTKAPFSPQLNQRLGISYSDRFPSVIYLSVHIFKQLQF